MLKILFNLQFHQIWQLVGGVEALKQEQGRDLYQKILEGPRNQELVDAIVTDLPRTFPDNIFFVNMQEERPSQLYRVLVAFAHQNKAVGYCQVCNNYELSRLLSYNIILFHLDLLYV